MAKRPLPSPEVLRQLLRYEPETGKLFWKERGPEWFKTKDRRGPEWAMRGWNSAFAGKEAFTTLTNGYRQGSVFGRGCLAHRLIWAIVHGEHPPEEIDHINGNRSDNRISNLRSVSSLDNAKNICRRSDNSSGTTGVMWNRASGKWRARIMVDQKEIHLGQFADIQAAIAARKAAEWKLGFHPNHGREPKPEMDA